MAYPQWFIELVRDTVYAGKNAETIRDFYPDLPNSIDEFTDPHIEALKMCEKIRTAKSSGLNVENILKRLSEFYGYTQKERLLPPEEQEKEIKTLLNADSLPEKIKPLLEKYKACWEYALKITASPGYENFDKTRHTDINDMVSNVRNELLRELGKEAKNVEKVVHIDEAQVNTTDFLRSLQTVIDIVHDSYIPDKDDIPRLDVDSLNQKWVERGKIGGRFNNDFVFDAFENDRPRSGLALVEPDENGHYRSVSLDELVNRRNNFNDEQKPYVKALISAVAAQNEIRNLANKLIGYLTVKGIPLRATTARVFVYHDPMRKKIIFKASNYSPCAFCSSKEFSSIQTQEAIVRQRDEGYITKQQILSTITFECQYSNNTRTESPISFSGIFSDIGLDLVPLSQAAFESQQKYEAEKVGCSENEVSVTDLLYRKELFNGDADTQNVPKNLMDNLSCYQIQFARFLGVAESFINEVDMFSLTGLRLLSNMSGRGILGESDKRFFDALMQDYYGGDTLLPIDQVADRIAEYVISRWDQLGAEDKTRYQHLIDIAIDIRQQQLGKDKNDELIPAYYGARPSVATEMAHISSAIEETRWMLLSLYSKEQQLTDDSPQTSQLLTDARLIYQRNSDYLEKLGKSRNSATRAQRQSLQEINTQLQMTLTKKTNLVPNQDRGNPKKSHAVLLQAERSVQNWEEINRKNKNIIQQEAKFQAAQANVSLIISKLKDKKQVRKVTQAELAYLACSLGSFITLPENFKVVEKKLHEHPVLAELFKKYKIRLLSEMEAYLKSLLGEEGIPDYFEPLLNEYKQAYIECLNNVGKLDFRKAEADLDADFRGCIPASLQKAKLKLFTTLEIFNENSFFEPAQLQKNILSMLNERMLPDLFKEEVENYERLYREFIDGLSHSDLGLDYSNRDNYTRSLNLYLKGQGGHNFLWSYQQIFTTKLQAYLATSPRKLHGAFFADTDSLQPVFNSELNRLVNYINEQFNWLCNNASELNKQTIKKFMGEFNQALSKEMGFDLSALPGEFPDKFERGEMCLINQYKRDAKQNEKGQSEYVSLVSEADIGALDSQEKELEIFVSKLDESYRELASYLITFFSTQQWSEQVGGFKIPFSILKEKGYCTLSTFCKSFCIPQVKISNNHEIHCEHVMTNIYSWPDNNKPIVLVIKLDIVVTFSRDEYANVISRAELKPTFFFRPQSGKEHEVKVYPGCLHESSLNSSDLIVAKEKYRNELLAFLGVKETKLAEVQFMSLLFIYEQTIPGQQSRKDELLEENVSDDEINLFKLLSEAVSVVAPEEVQYKDIVQKIMNFFSDHEAMVRNAKPSQRVRYQALKNIITDASQFYQADENELQQLQVQALVADPVTMKPSALRDQISDAAKFDLKTRKRQRRSFSFRNQPPSPLETQHASLASHVDTLQQHFIMSNEYVRDLYLNGDGKLVNPLRLFELESKEVNALREILFYGPEFGYLKNLFELRLVLAKNDVFDQNTGQSIFSLSDAAKAIVNRVLNKLASVEEKDDKQRLRDFINGLTKVLIKEKMQGTLTTIDDLDKLKGIIDTLITTAQQTETFIPKEANIYRELFIDTLLSNKAISADELSALVGKIKETTPNGIPFLSVLDKNRDRIFGDLPRVFIEYLAAVYEKYQKTQQVSDQAEPPPDPMQEFVKRQIDGSKLGSQRNKLSILKSMLGKVVSGNPDSVCQRMLEKVNVLEAGIQQQADQQSREAAQAAAAAAAPQAPTPPASSTSSSKEEDESKDEFTPVPSATASDVEGDETATVETASRAALTPEQQREIEIKFGEIIKELFTGDKLQFLLQALNKLNFTESSAGVSTTAGVGSGAGPDTQAGKKEHRFTRSSDDAKVCFSENEAGTLHFSYDEEKPTDEIASELQSIAEQLIKDIVTTAASNQDNPDFTSDKLEIVIKCDDPDFQSELEKALENALEEKGIHVHQSNVTVEFFSP